MRLRKLEVRAFAGVHEAKLEFGHGLNVLYGPNELGKSSLVHAIRSALLLQDSSTSRDVFEDWHTDEPPQVVLEFETEPERVWRVRKSFGSGSDAFSYLEFSRDGRTFTQEARGREVDGRLAELLQWGIEPPGGRGRRKKGIPGSFIATALIGDQKRVEEIFERDLAGDPDESGKQRLTEALQALAEDPLFKQILQTAQARVDDAFTATGRRKSGRHSPWVQIRDERNAAESRRAEVDELQQRSEGARLRIQELQDELIRARENAEQASDRHRGLEAAWKQQESRRAASESVEQAAAEVQRIKALHDAVRETETSLTSARTEAEEAAKTHATAKRRHEEATSALEAARARERELQGDGAEQQRRIREQEIENKTLEARSRQSDLAGRVEQAQKAGQLAESVQSKRAAVEQLAATVAEASEVLQAAREATERDREALARLRLQTQVQTCLEARQKLSQLEEKHQAGLALRSEHSQLTEQAAALRAEISKRQAPTADEIGELSRLRTELRVAEEKLEVGLSVVVTPHGELDLSAVVDGESSRSGGPTREPARFEAKSSLRLLLPDAEIEVRGGSQQLQADAQRLGQQWATELQPKLEAAQCGSYEELQALAARTTDDLTRATALESEAAAALARAEGAAVDDGELSGAQADVHRAEEQLAANLPEHQDVDSFLQQAGASDAAEHPAGATEELEGEIERRRDLANQLEVTLSRDQARLESGREELTALEREAEEACRGFSHAWDVILDSSNRELATVRGELQGHARDLEAITTAASSEVAGARRAVEEAGTALQARQSEVDEADTTLQSARSKVVRQEGELTAKQATAAAENLGAAEERLSREQGQLDALPDPGPEVTEVALAGSQSALEQARGHVREAELQLRQAEGALEQVGGAYIEEQLQQAEESLRAVGDREHELEVDYGAWKLLLETMKQAESEEAAHLGAALLEPVRERMADLTEGRYGDISLGPHLDTHGIELAGEERDVESLSVGTREQLATVLRLSIAEALRSCVVLDDQLTQTDPDRMARLRQLLRTCAEDVQVVVFTCRPEDYLSEEELGNEGPRVRAVALQPLLERSLQAPAARKPRRAPAAPAAPELEPTEPPASAEPAQHQQATAGRPAAGTPPAQPVLSAPPIASPAEPSTSPSETSQLLSALRDALPGTSPMSTNGSPVSEQMSLRDTAERVARLLGDAWATDSSLRLDEIEARLLEAGLAPSSGNVRTALDWLVQVGLVVASKTGFAAIGDSDEMQSELQAEWPPEQSESPTQG